MAGLINLGAGLSALGGSIAQTAGDAALLSQKQMLEEQSMRLANTLATEREYNAPGVAEDVALKRLNLAFMAGKLSLLNPDASDDTEGVSDKIAAPPAPASDATTPAPVAAGTGPSATTATKPPSTDVIAQMGARIGLSPREAHATYVTDSAKFFDMVNDALKGTVVRSESQLVGRDEQGNPKVLFSNLPKPAQPFTDADRQAYGLTPDAKGFIDDKGQPHIVSKNNPNDPFNADGTPNKAFQDWEINKQRLAIPIAGARAAAEETARVAASPDKYTEPKMVEIDDPNKPGERTQVMGQQDKTTSQWVTADENRTPLKNATLPGGTGGMRSQVMIGRVLGSAHTVSNEIENLVALPGNATVGLTGTPEGNGILGSIKANLQRKVQPQEVQSAQVAMAGMSRALAQMETMGLAPQGTFINQMDTYKLQEGDTELTRLQKIASVRQTADGMLDSISNQPATTAAQKKEIQGLKDRLEKAVPFLPIDVIKLANSKNPKATLGDVAKATGLGAQTGTQFPVPPQPAVEELRARGRGAAPQFDQIFGPGAADKILGAPR